MPYILLLGLIAVLPSISEEITIRGIVLSGYEEKNKYIATAVTGLFFGILHLDPHQFLYTTILGFIFALVVRITNSIYSSMLMHFIINGTSATLAKLSNLFMQGIETVNETKELTLKYLNLSEKLSMLYFFGALAAFFVVIVYYILRKLEKVSTEEVNNERKIIELDYGFRNTDGLIEEDRIINIPFILAIIILIAEVG
nr:CPBP family intramembrane glutamic endopeptidase [Caproiciproducens sp. MSJ-32]